MRDILQQALRKLARLLVIPTPQTAVERAKPEAEALIHEIPKEFDQARQQAELANFEIEESPSRDRVSTRSTGTVLEPAEDIFVPATSLASDRAWDEWQQLPLAVQVAESELRNAAAKRLERAASLVVPKNDGADLAITLDSWKQAVAQLPETQRDALRRFHHRSIATARERLRSHLDKPETLVKLYAILGRIRLASSDAVLTAAEECCDRIVDCT